jgi:hypothetical protein
MKKKSRKVPGESMQRRSAKSEWQSSKYIYE